MADMMTFPDTVEEFMEQYKIVDTEQVYTNRTELVPIFRMRQWFEHSKPCNDVVSRQAAIDVLSLGKEILSRVLDDTDVVGTDREKYSWGLRLIESSIEDIKELAPAQPDIVHCPDCKYGMHSGCGDRYICNVNYELRMEHDSTFYCGYGKRREE